MKRGQSKAQQQYIQGFFKRKPCQRQADAGQCSAGQSQSTRQGQVGQHISSPEPAARVRASEDYTSSHLSAATEHEQFLQKVH